MMMMSSASVVWKIDDGRNAFVRTESKVLSQFCFTIREICYYTGNLCQTFRPDRTWFDRHEDEVTRVE
ncbi:hypothetical protein RP20_CCG008823 [Aedes albopictus]|nr:hypothetical protein RP20_CCG008823 [Aedes albopictus]